MTFITDLEALIGNDAPKAIAAMPVLTQAIANGQAALTADEHKDFATKTVDLVQVAQSSVDAAAAAGVIGKTDASHVDLVGNQITSTTGFAAVFGEFIATVKSWFGFH